MTLTVYRALAAGLALGAGVAAAAVPSRPQERCVTALNQGGARLQKAAGTNFLRCVQRAAADKLPPGQTCDQCLVADPDGTVARGEAYVTGVAARNCTVAPEFGPKTAGDVNGAFASPLGVTEVFGPSLDAALIDGATDGAGAACQRAVAAAMVRIASARIKAFNACKKAGLKRHTIPSAKALRECLDGDTGHRVSAAVTRAQAAANASCAGTSIAAAFPGECAGEPLATLFACVAPVVECSACLAIDAADGVGKGCHRYVDGVAVRYCGTPPATSNSVARQWDEETLAAVRIDTPRPTVHARNLFHLSAVMWDAWRAYGGGGSAFLVDEAHASGDPEGDRGTAISFAAYRLLSHRYALSANAAASQASFDARMAALGYDKSYTSTVGDDPVAVGNRIASAMIAFGQSDGANEQGNYADPTYVPVNDPMVVKLPGTTMNDPNRWQPLALDVIVTQNDIVLPGKIQGGIGMRWNGVTPFALPPPAIPGDVHIDPGPPPLLGTATDADFKQSAVYVIQLSSELTPDDGATIDISPGAYGNNPLGTNDGTGHPLNPSTGLPYDPQVVKRGDFARVLAEFWADGPASETPPGHWNTLANYLSDHPLLGPKKIGGTGPVVSDLEWDVKLYLGLNGAVHDAAIVAWGLKRKYDSVRPISMIRYMGGLGQSSDVGGPSYHPEGLPLVPGLIEVITAATTAPGERHELLAGHEGEIAILAWPATPGDTYAGVRWIRAVTWVPYQKPTFVTPAFPGYTSGHSTFSRAAAEFLTSFTGSAFFPGGLGEFVANANTYLTFEKGPTTTVKLQWATYYDAADQAGQSRPYGGIHVLADDFNGRITGSQIGIGAYAKAQQYYDGTVGP